MIGCYWVDAKLCVYFPALQACCPDCREVYQKGKK